MKRIWLSSPAMSGKEMCFIKQAFEDNYVAPLGPNVDTFENEICKYTGAEYAVAMNTGTAAIHMALRYLGVTNGDIVFCSSLTFAASCNPIIYEGGIPVFIDSEPESWNISPKALEKAFQKYPNPKAVIVVHLYGQSADMDTIVDICSMYNVPIIEDAAESLGATYNSKQTGTIGMFGIYSFNGNKIITTSGGGMLICPDEESKKKVTKWITQSRDPARHYLHSELGFNYRLSNICAGIGLGQLSVLEERIQHKRDIYNTYKKHFSNISFIKMMPVCSYGKPNYWLSCMTVDGDCGVLPEDIITRLDEHNIESRPVWHPMHLQQFYEGYDFFAHSSDVSGDIFRRGLCLPSDVNMTREEQSRVCELISEMF